MGNPFQTLAAGILLAGSSWAQQNMDISILGGLSQGGTTTITGSTVQATSPASPSFAINYGYQVLRRPAGELWIELPLTWGYLSSEATVSPGSVAAATNTMFTVAPGVRFRIPTQSRLSAYGVAGLGYARFEHDQTVTLLNGIQVQHQVLSHGVFDAGGGVDLRLTRLVSLRGEIRDFITGRNLGGRSGRNHPFYEFGLALHF